jgi:hypothetical protein
VSTTNVQEPNEAGQGRTLLAWHFARDDSRQSYRPFAVIEPGGTEVLAGHRRLVLCEWGLHAAVRPLDALAYGKGLLVRRVELGGRIVAGDDKACATERRELWRVEGRRPLLEWTIWTAHQYVDALRDGCTGFQAQSRRLLTTIAELLDGRCDALTVRMMLAQTPNSSGVVVQLVHAAVGDGSVLHVAFDAANVLCKTAANAANSDFAYSQTEAVCNAELERRLLALAPEATR